MSTRNAWIAGAIVVLAGCRAEPRPVEPPAIERRAALEDPRAALTQILDELADRQGEDGAWRDGPAFADAVSATALAAIALTRDRDPARDEDEETVRRGVKWLVFQMRSGTWSEPGGPPVPPYVHALAATAMAEGYGRSKSFLLRPYAQRSIDRAATLDVGDDPWARGWQVLALRTAESAGLKAPAGAIDAGVAAIDELVRARDLSLDEHARVALAAIASIARSRSKSTVPAGSAVAADLQPFDVARDDSWAALDRTHLALRALAEAGDASAATERWRADIARASCARWSERSAADASSTFAGRNPDSVAWRARLALCLVEALALTEPAVSSVDAARLRAPRSDTPAASRRP